MPVDALWTDVAMDVILRTLFSESAQADARDAAWATQTLSETAFREMFMPFTLPDWLPLPGKAAKRRAIRSLKGLAWRYIHARQAEVAAPGAPDRSDLLHMLLALRDEHDREAALVTFLVTASGLTVMGIGSAFWGLVAGAVTLPLLHYGQRRQAAR